VTAALPATPPAGAQAGPVRRLALVGLPASGKTAVAASLAQRLRWRLVDTDAMVEARSGRSVAEVFAAEGEAGFRRRERAALEEALCDAGPQVIACGGGLVTDDASWSLLLEHCCTVWLDAPDEVLLARLGDTGSRPLLSGDPGPRLAALRRLRAPLYARASLRVDISDGDVEEVCDRVADAVSGMRLSLEEAGLAPVPQRRVHVELGERAYDVVVGHGAAREVAGHLPAGCARVAVVADRRVLHLARGVLDTVRRSGRWGGIVALRGGEELKTWRQAGRLLERLAQLRLQRDDAVVAVGGGTVGDVAGFCAATYDRGVALVQVPTTLLAMVDAAVGGKTGVNLTRGKNLAGAFWQPRAVLADLDALRTLPRRALRAACSEIVKYGMIAPAPELVALLDTRLDTLLTLDDQAVTEVVLRCVAVKAEVVGGDERETGRRAILNYGHTTAHAIEAATAYRSLLHGEALALGLRVAGALSVAHAGCPPADIAWQDELLRRCVDTPRPRLEVDAVLDRLHSDKKSRGGSVRWVLVERRGAASWGHGLPDGAVRAALATVLG